MVEQLIKAALAHGGGFAAGLIVGMAIWSIPWWLERKERMALSKSVLGLATAQTEALGNHTHVIDKLSEKVH